LRNFFKLYHPIADRWFFYDNSDNANLKLIANGNLLNVREIFQVEIWNILNKIYGKEDSKNNQSDKIKQITETLQRAVREAVLNHQRAGNPIAVWKDEKAVWVQSTNG
jgi:vancomycin resistance protein YoaR